MYIGLLSVLLETCKRKIRIKHVTNLYLIHRSILERTGAAVTRARILEVTTTFTASTGLTTETDH